MNYSLVAKARRCHLLEITNIDLCLIPSQSRPSRRKCNKARWVEDDSSSYINAQLEDIYLYGSSLHRMALCVFKNIFISFHFLFSSSSLVFLLPLFLFPVPIVLIITLTLSFHFFFLSFEITFFTLFLVFTCFVLFFSFY